MTTSTAAPKKRRKPATRPGGATPASSPSVGHSIPAAFLPEPSVEYAPAEEYVPTTTPVAAPEPAPVQKTPVHPYDVGVALFTYQPKDGAPPIVFPHISTCPPDALFLYDNRNKDELRQCFAWMDRAGIPDAIGRRVWALPPSEQAEIVSGWFSGLVVNGPEGVSPPGEF